jgi:hypothetical protein
VAERNGLLNRRTGYTVPWVRIPPSPPSAAEAAFGGRSPQEAVKELLPSSPAEAKRRWGPLKRIFSKWI